MLHDKYGKTIIFITHDMDLVAEYAKRCIVMKDGRIMLDGVPHEIFLHYEELEKTHLKPPMITLLFKELGERYGLRRDILTVDEALEYLKTKLVS
jgi:energy-coupling factor transport system ATP-binding protein